MLSHNHFNFLFYIVINATVPGWKTRIDTLTSDRYACQGIAIIAATSSALGTNKDMENMERVFMELNFAVFPMSNPHVNDMKALIRAIAAVTFNKRFYKIHSLLFCWLWTN